MNELWILMNSKEWNFSEKSEWKRERKKEGEEERKKMWTCLTNSSQEFFFREEFPQKVSNSMTYTWMVSIVYIVIYFGFFLS